MSDLKTSKGNVVYWSLDKFFKNVTPLKEPYMKLLMSSLITWSGLPKEITQALESGCLKACSSAKGTCPKGENPPLSAYNRSYWSFTQVDRSNTKAAV